MTTSKSTPTYPPNYALRKRDQRMKKYARPKWCRNWLRSQKGKWSKWKWILPLSFGFSCGWKKVSHLKIKCGNTWEFVRKLLIKSFHLKSRPRRISTLIFFSCNYVQQLKKELAKRKSRSLSLSFIFAGNCSSAAFFQQLFQPDKKNLRLLMQRTQLFAMCERVLPMFPFPSRWRLLSDGIYAPIVTSIGHLHLAFALRLPTANWIDFRMHFPVDYTRFDCIRIKA